MTKHELIIFAFGVVIGALKLSQIQSAIALYKRRGEIRRWLRYGRA